MDFRFRVIDFGLLRVVPGCDSLSIPGCYYTFDSGLFPGYYVLLLPGFRFRVVTRLSIPGCFWLITRC